MAMDVINDFVVRLFGQVDEKSFEKMGDTVDAVGEKIKTFAGIAVAALTTGAFVSAIRETATRFDELGDAASRMGQSANAIDQIAYAASLAGTDAQTAMRSIESLSNTIGQAINGVGRGAKAFETFGISVKNADGSAKDLPQVLDSIRAKLAEMGSTAEKTAFLQRLGMDSSMLEYLTLEQQKLNALNAEYKQRERIMGVNAEAMAEMSGDFNDAVDRMGHNIDNVWTRFVSQILPPVTNALNGLTAWFLRNGDSFSGIIDPAAKAFGFIVDQIAFVVTQILDFNAALGNAPVYILAVATAFKLLNAIFTASPLGKLLMLITAVTTALAYLWDDFQTWREGGDSLFDWTNAAGVLNWVIELFNNLKDSAIAVFNTISDKLAQFYGYLSDTGALTGMGEIARGVFDIINGGITTVVAALQGFAGLLIGVATGDFSLFHKATNNLIKGLTQLWDGFIGYFGGLWDTFNGLLNGALDKAWQLLTGWLSDAWNAVKNFFSDLFSTDEAAAQKRFDAQSFSRVTYQPTPRPGSEVAPGTYNNTSTTTNNDNRSNTANVTINVQNKDEAVAVADSFARDRGSAA